MPNFILNFEFIVIDDFIKFNCGMILSDLLIKKKFDK